MGPQAATAVPGLPPPSHVSCSSSCPQVSHSPGQHTIQSTWVTPSVQESFQDHHGGPQEGSGWPRNTNTEAAAEAECPAPAPQDPTADDMALWDTAQRIVSGAVRRAVAEILGAVQEPEEQQDLAQCVDLQDGNSKEACQGRDTIHSIWINPSVQEHHQDTPAGPQEGSGLPSCTDMEAVAEAESLAPAQHSPTEDDVALSDIVEYILSKMKTLCLKMPGCINTPYLEFCKSTDMVFPGVLVASLVISGLEKWMLGGKLAEQ
ncbi:hypothetical protein AV530_011588 [Patagioenas fasciata monilis]|uniref:Uncharacterized protein n=1 Tax=Patagioenas fasciata monilis TaxID=372326 RepID=A0A1V4KNF5_PATFA|nr:hypothetical protein AV530_011588 [Patagioenas fasciata monilis]